MAYIARVELHDAHNEDYDILHGAMLEISFYRSIICQSKSWKLPTGTYYNSVSDVAVGELHVKVASAAARTKRRYWIFLVQQGKEGFGITSEDFMLSGYGATTAPTTCFGK